MRYIWTIIWAFLLSFMAAYVISNMSGGSFAFSQVIVTTILFTLAAIILGEGVITDADEA
ncbi:YjzD family protein [Halobacillus salinus]|uniref:YjzD family protein n=1 Tax=Halobacillus salinus TaxID=192814 RepID=UPI0009A58F20|nr:YjzD family protein [Halobacillus salinus]